MMETMASWGTWIQGPGTTDPGSEDSNHPAVFLYSLLFPMQRACCFLFLSMFKKLENVCALVCTNTHTQTERGRGESILPPSIQRFWQHTTHMLLCPSWRKRWWAPAIRGFIL